MSRSPILIVLALIVLLVIAAAVVAIIAVTRASHRYAIAKGYELGSATQLAPPLTASARLAQLEQLRTAGQISDGEYRAKRAEVIGGL